MAETPFDVVVSDMRMPGMDGAQLLDEVKTRFPRTVRLVLSGQSDRETIFRSVGPSHQYFSKPCDVDELKQKINHAFALRELAGEPPPEGDRLVRLKLCPACLRSMWQ